VIEIVPTPTAASTATTIRPESLGSARFRAEYGIRYAYLTGAMYRGIASQAMVIALGRAGLMGYFGTGGLGLDEIESAIRAIQQALPDGQAYGMNLLPSLDGSDREERRVDLFCRYGVRRVEAAAYLQVTPALVRYRLRGLALDPQGQILRRHRLLAKVSRHEVASVFMQPAPDVIVRGLLARGDIAPAQAQLAAHVPMADEICVEADSGGHTDRGVAYALMPAMLALRAETRARHRYADPIYLGAAGGIGTPEAAAAAFVMGADFVLTGSINQCTVEAGTSDVVKDLLQDINVQDTTYAPAGDMFEAGSKVQVLKRGSMFAPRANKLYELYQRHGSLEELEASARQLIETKYFARSLTEVWRECRSHYLETNPTKLTTIEAHPKQKMAAVFRWYFLHTSSRALRGDPEFRADYQVHCGPALGAFNQWVKGTPLATWRHRHVADLAQRIMQGAADLLTERFQALTGAR
jgi:trans-AT polyketide synthase/acyltransferase/oxidoreductase domain-containing protein